jgi:pimeloyl-ACP methyl ester carboxylesterase
MTDFGLVHGAYHGAWCWERLTPELECLGHRVFTVDLPAEDPQAGAAEYAAAAVTAFADEDLVLVGHSLGGLTIPLIAASRPARQLIFLADTIPRPGKTHDEVARRGAGHGPARPEGRSLPGIRRGHPVATRSRRLLVLRRLPHRTGGLGRGTHARAVLEDHQRDDPLSAWPGTPCAYLLGAHDPVINPAWSRSAARSVG